MNPSHSKVCSTRVLVIGGGIAGSSCALRLAQQGIDVELVEKSYFPRPKVCGCCLGGTGLAALEQLSLRAGVIQLGVSTNRWCGSLDSLRVDLPLPSGVAISREVFDPFLLDAATLAGVQVSMGCTAVIEPRPPSAPRVRLKFPDGSLTRRYDVIVVASGLSGTGLSAVLPWRRKPHGPFGVSCIVDSMSLETGTIYMACTNDGYVGLVSLADGRVDMAAALSSGALASKQGSPLTRMQAILDASAFDLPPIARVANLMTTAPLRRKRIFGNGNVIAIGDAAGYVEPFTGEGMTWALQSGIAAADLIVRTDDLSSIGVSWQTDLQKLLRSHHRICQTVTDLCHSKPLRIMTGHALSRFPILAEPLIRYLNRA